MRKALFVAGLIAAVAVPCLAFAQPDPNCQRSNSQTSTEGTVLGALGGALIGNAIAGRHDRGVGTVGGALAGGVAGNVLAGQHNDPCPVYDPNYQGYSQPGYSNGYPPPPPPPSSYNSGYDSYNNPPPPQPQGYNSGYNGYNAPPPPSYGDTDQGGYDAPPPPPGNYVNGGYYQGGYNSPPPQQTYQGYGQPSYNGYPQ